MRIPPLDTEQALDLVLALPAHRSQNSQHAAFGALLLQEYFVKLRDRYKDDEAAIGYLDNLFACIASTVRAFSVERDIFGTRWQSKIRQREHSIERANRLDKYSPFREDGVWGKFFASIGGAGTGAFAGAIIQTILNGSNWIAIGGALLGIVVGLFAFDIALDALRNRILRQVEANVPADIVKTWEAETIVNYRKILRHFLVSAIKIREEWYPELSSLNGRRIFSTYEVPHIHFANDDSSSEARQPIVLLEDELDKIISRHMALGRN